MVDRRGGDRRTGGERREHERRRQHGAPASAPWRQSLRVPSRTEQIVQFLTRYLFEFLGLIFFNVAIAQAPLHLDLATINSAYALHILLNTLFFLHMFWRPEAGIRYRLAMWADILLVGLSVLCDPNGIPPSLLAFIMIVLGNGMRYGLRMFGEAVAGCIGIGMFAVTLRFYAPEGHFNAGLLFLNLFGAIILVYAYILMSRIESSRDQLERKSKLDTLTGLDNRRALFEQADILFDRMRRENGQLTVLFADMDKFKQVNDTHGHATGDLVLQQVGQILRGATRTYDLKARLGGDEFVVVLPGLGAAQGHQVALRIQRELSDWTRDKGLSCSLSIGLGEAPAQGDDLKSLLHRVDQAMYQSKASRRPGGIRYVDINSAADPV